MRLKVLRADPAGNITLFVLTPVKKERRAAVAAALMQALPEMKIEQVGFACEPEKDADGHMEMMGGEFCGNATRAYGMYLARQCGGRAAVRLRVSGCGHIVTVRTDILRGTASAEMPLPRSVCPVRVDGTDGTMVDLGGIVHLVVTDTAPDEKWMKAAESVLQNGKTMDACGVIFLDRAEHRMTPLVKVIETDTLVWEGSCGSGSIACAVAESEGLRDGTFEQEYIQPAGVVRTRVVRCDGKVSSAEIDGPVSLGEMVEVEIE